MSLIISPEDPRTEDVKALLQSHLKFCQSVTPPEGVYALDVERLRKPGVTVFAARENGQLLGVGALRELEPGHAELKSMHTLKNARGRGVGTAMVQHLLEFARSRGVSRVSLETGNYEPFEPARRLYASFGFQPCEPFGEYEATDISVCMTLHLEKPKIIVEEPNPDWPSWFAKIAYYIRPHLLGISNYIEHVGSTSVSGLAAKPIIDIDVVVDEQTKVSEAIKALEKIGYDWQGDLGIAGREAFKRPSSPLLPKHNLYVVVKDNKAHLDHWLLRDSLRADDRLRDEYGSLKKRNATISKGDIDVYLDLKAEFITRVLQVSREKRSLETATDSSPQSTEAPDQSP